MNQRKLKVYESPNSKSRNIPCIRLQGHWLKRLGFETGDNIIVREEEGKLVIEHIDKVALVLSGKAL